MTYMSKLFGFLFFFLFCSSFLSDPCCFFSFIKLCTHEEISIIMNIIIANKGDNSVSCLCWFYQRRGEDDVKPVETKRETEKKQINIRTIQDC